jgi:hypothetical protein
MPISPAEQSIAAVLSAANPGTVADVVALMQSLDTLLPAHDGLRWFNRLYLMVTEQVHTAQNEGAWQSPAWLDRLDVRFAGLYFDALRASLAGQSMPSAWTAVFESRFQTGIDRIQFALAGMNAHINHDLALALLETDAELNVVPADDGPEHRDYEAVNVMLNGLMPATLTMLASDALGVLAEDTGRVGRLLAFWNICKARDLAWDFANQLRNLAGPARAVVLNMQDAVTGALGRAILTQI